MASLPTARVATWVLVTLLALVHLGRWFGKGSMPHGWSQRSQLAAQRVQNDEAQRRNQRMAAEVLDLKAGLEMIEEKARGELGMVKPDEVFVQVSPKR